jgi:hypothetical protein
MGMRYLDRAIIGKTVHHEDLAGDPREALNAPLEVFLLIEGHDHGDDTHQLLFRKLAVDAGATIVSSLCIARVTMAVPISVRNLPLLE